MSRMTLAVVVVLAMVFAFAMARRSNVLSSARQTAGNGYGNISASQLEGMRAGNSGIVLVDVREPGEYASGHIPGAILIPLGAIGDRSGELSKDADIALICRSGNRSSQAETILARKGFTRLYNLQGGMSGWTGPVKTGSSK